MASSRRSYATAFVNMILCPLVYCTQVGLKERWVAFVYTAEELDNRRCHVLDKKQGQSNKVRDADHSRYSQRLVLSSAR